MHCGTEPVCLASRADQTAMADGQGSEVRLLQFQCSTCRFAKAMVSNSSESGIPTHKSAALEAYDAMLSDFLASVLKNTMQNTLILLKGDHGQHSGPETVEFDVQVEHRMPWGRLLVPSRLVPNAGRLLTNAGRLVSPFDLHATLQAALLRDSRIGQRAQPEEVQATASNAPIDLLMTEVPALRTCREARIPDWLCPCQHERLASGDASYGPFGVPRPDQIESKEILRKKAARLRLRKKAREKA